MQPHVQPLRRVGLKELITGKDSQKRVAHAAHLYSGQHFRPHFHLGATSVRVQTVSRTHLILACVVIYYQLNANVFNLYNNNNNNNKFYL
jgi:hypothetical protein